MTKKSYTIECIAKDKGQLIGEWSQSVDATSALNSFEKVFEMIIAEHGEIDYIKMKRNLLTVRYEL